MLRKIGINFVLVGFSILLLWAFASRAEQKNLLIPFETGALLAFATMCFVVGLVIVIFSKKKEEK